MKRLIFIVFLLFFLPAVSQELTREMRMTYLEELTQTKLKPAIHKLYYEARTDEEKTSLSREIFHLFDEALRMPHVQDYNFDSLQKDIGILRSPDGMFRIVHWQVPKNDGTSEYFGFLQVKKTKEQKQGLGDDYFLYELKDKSAEIKNPENSILTPEKWFGCLYNRIIVKKTKTKTYYTLLGYDPNDKLTKKKIIDVLTIDENGKVKFGADIFSYQRKYPKRVIFEYSASCSISLRYSNKKDSIVFEHLAPTSPQLEGQFQYYCSDMSYDGFGFKNGKWNYGTDINPLNEKDENDKYYGNPGDIKEGHEESEYLNPKDKAIKKDKKSDNLKKENGKKKP